MEGDFKLKPLSLAVHPPQQRVVNGVPAVDRGLPVYDELPQRVVAPAASLSGWAVYGSPDVPVARDNFSRSDPDYPFVKVYAQNLWWEYMRRSGSFRLRLKRVTWPAVGYMIAAAVLIFLFGRPIAPIRGQVNWLIDIGAMLVMIVASCYFTFFVLHGAYLSSRFIGYLNRTDTHWPLGAMVQFARLNLEPFDLTEYLDIRMIAMRTKIVGKYVYYPFIIFILLVVSRNSLFDNWDWPPGLVMVFAIQGLLAVLGALMLRRAAEAARRRALAKLADRYTGHLAAGRNAAAAAVEQLIDRVRQEREGAFSVLSQYPTLAAIILPSSGIGLWALLEYLARFVG